MQQSLFDTTGGTSLTASATWIESVVLGDAAIGLCVVGVAVIGALMLTGRLPLREGTRVAVGCFVLLGAPVIAHDLRERGSPFGSGSQGAVLISAQSTPRPELPPETYNPYAQASVRDGQ